MRPNFRPYGAVLSVVVFLSACHRVAPTPAILSTPPADQLRADVTVLASAEFDGRGTGTAGNDSAAVFIARRYNALRLASIAQANYSAAKGGVVSLVRSAAAGLYKYGDLLPCPLLLRRRFHLSLPGAPRAMRRHQYPGAGERIEPPVRLLQESGDVLVESRSDCDTHVSSSDRGWTPCPE